MALAVHETINECLSSQVPSPALYLVDDESDVLEGLNASLRAMGFQPRPFTDPNEMLLDTSEDEFGCVITDLKMPGMGGVELQHQLLQRGSCLSLILLTGFADVPTTVTAMKRGALSVIEKPFDLQALAREIRAAMQYSESEFKKRQRLRSAAERLAMLSVEEKAVLELAIEGVPNRQIARELSISPRTVDRRRQSALAKLQAESVAEYAILKTLTAPEE